jgi:hypothetical protein
MPEVGFSQNNSSVGAADGVDDGLVEMVGWDVKVGTFDGDMDDVG